MQRHRLPPSSPQPARKQHRRRLRLCIRIPPLILPLLPILALLLARDTWGEEARIREVDALLVSLELLELVSDGREGDDADAVFGECGEDEASEEEQAQVVGPELGFDVGWGGRRGDVGEGTGHHPGVVDEDGELLWVGGDDAGGGANGGEVGEVDEEGANVGGGDLGEDGRLGLVETDWESERFEEVRDAACRSVSTYED